VRPGGKRAHFRGKIEMKWKIAAAVASAIAVSACGAAIVKAQTTAPAYLPAYFVALVNVKDEEGYTKEFLPKVQPLIKEAGGEYVAGGFNKTHPITGEPPPNRVVIIRFEGGLSAIGEWYEKQKSIEEEIGHKYATFQSFAVEGVEPRR
jgi:uncharacterized protein (DUF1330 family)